MQIGQLLAEIWLQNVKTDLECQEKWARFIGLGCGGVAFDMLSFECMPD